MSDNTPRDHEGPERLDASLENTTQRTGIDTTWANLSDFQRNPLAAIARLKDTADPSDGLAIKACLETDRKETADTSAVIDSSGVTTSVRRPIPDALEPSPSGRDA
ncbi:hypothetical protein AB7C87_03310 [Natrarchaeobius sp. A-rgal3]|uniref:hypothetical protein n=1 Tax=Natrarchaeobius versutus TaxID=1679078 RepID=UPI00350EA59E